MDSQIVDVAGRALDGTGCTRDEALRLASPDIPLEDLLYWADAIRRKHKGNRIALCGIVNARSGRCSENCRFCAQSAHHKTEAQVYPLLSSEEMIEAARQAKANGATCFGIVTAGATVKGAELDGIVDAIKVITGELKLCCSASLGKISGEDMLRLKDAGMTRYHHNLETSERFFPQVCTTHTWEERVETLRAAQAVGVPVCCGGLLGMGEEWQDRVDLAMTCQEFGVESVPLNFLHAVPGTPMEEVEPVPPMDILRTLAIFRFVLPTAHIRMCGGREVNLRDLQSHIFRAGASGMMVGDYLTRDGRGVEDDLAMLRDLGLTWVKEEA
ncbi:MAG: biotin synthase BioB [Planctomycetota bacterium]|jgi:biotin synthase